MKVKIKPPMTTKSVISQSEAAKLIRDIRRASNVTLESVANETSINIGTLSQMERGQVAWSEKSFVKVANAISKCRK